MELHLGGLVLRLRRPQEERHRVLQRRKARQAEVVLRTRILGNPFGVRLGPDLRLFVARLLAGVLEERRKPRADRLGGGLGRAVGVGLRRLRRRRGLSLAQHDDRLAVQDRRHLHGRLARHQALRIAVQQRFEDRRRGRHPGAPLRRQEQGLFAGPPADQGVDDDPLASDLGLAPQFHGAGRLDRRALVEPPQHARAVKVVQADVEGEGRERVELVLGQRREHRLVDRVADGDQVVEQQGLGVVLRHLGALARGQGVAMADRPAPIGELSGRSAVALEPLDQFDRGSGHTVARLHAL